jgi:hypothetical protein
MTDEANQFKCRSQKSHLHSAHQFKPKTLLPVCITLHLFTHHSTSGDINNKFGDLIAAPTATKQSLWYENYNRLKEHIT